MDSRAEKRHPWKKLKRVFSGSKDSALARLAFGRNEKSREKSSSKNKSCKLTFSMPGLSTPERQKFMKDSSSDLATLAPKEGPMKCVNAELLISTS